MAALFFILTTAFSLLPSSAHSAALLSLNCTPPPPQSTPSLTRLLDRLIDQARPAHFAVSSLAVNQTNITGLVQCRSEVDPVRCSQCARFAKRTVLSVCPDSESVSAWFDVCYVEASSMGRFTLGPTLTRSCSGTRPVHWTGFEPALSVLVASLRTVPVGVLDDQFSYGKTISSGGETMQGQIECVRTLSVSECRSCVDQALEKLHRRCNGGYAIVDNRCIARFGLMAALVVDSSGHGGEGNRRRRKLVVLCWGLVAACLAGFVWIVWLIQRSIVNGAKVAALPTTTTTTQDGDKYVVDSL